VAASDVIELVDVHLAAERVAVDAEESGSAGLVAVGAFESALDEFLLEFRYGLLEEDAALDHHCNQGFQLISHSSTLRDTACCREEISFAGLPPGSL
jgi:hypothetical protein